MKILKYFFDCYFYQTKNFDDLDNVIQDFKLTEDLGYKLQFIRELHHIIQLKNYDFASKFINKHGNRTFNQEKTKKFINFLYDRLINGPTNVKPQDFKHNLKGVFCPNCTPDIEKAITFSLIDKATVIANNMQIYICKPCRLVWLDEDDIRADNALVYKVFMKTNRLNRWWN